MANDRLNIYCRHCGEGHAFIKYYPTKKAGGIGMGYVVPCSDSELAQEFDDWAQEHIHCAEKKNRTTLHLCGDHVFEIRAESDGNYNPVERRN